jgi:hypothetical protein
VLLFACSRKSPSSPRAGLYEIDAFGLNDQARVARLRELEHAGGRSTFEIKAEAKLAAVELSVVSYCLRRALAEAHGYTRVCTANGKPDHGSEDSVAPVQPTTVALSNDSSCPEDFIVRKYRALDERQGASKAPLMCSKIRTVARSIARSKSGV